MPLYVWSPFFSYVGYANCIFSNFQEALEGYRACMMEERSNPEEVRKRAMADPEVQAILRDPAMRMILEQMQNDPRALQE